MKRIFPLLIIIFVAFVFFYQTIFFGKIPFPGDLLIAEYAPWKYESYLGFNPGSYPHKAQYFDVIQQLYPWKQLVIEQLKKGQVPLWNPYNFSGSPLLANMQSAVFSPINIIYFFFPMTVAWSISTMSQTILASLFMYLFLRKKRIDSLPAIFASLAFAYSLYMAVFLEYNTIGFIVALLPLNLYLLEILVERQTRLRQILFSLSIAILFFAGHLQLSFYVLGFVMLFYFFRLRNNPSVLLTLFFLTVLGLMIASLQLLPTFELIMYSARSPHTFEFLIQKLLIQPWQLIMLFSPDVFGNPATRNFLAGETYPTKAMFFGSAPLLFAIIAIFAKIRIEQKNFFLSFVLIFIFVLTRNPISEVFYSLQIPFLSSSSPSNAMFLLIFVLSYFAAWGMHYWIKGENITFRQFAAYVAFFLLFLLLAIPARQFMQERNAIFSLIFISLSISLLFLSRFLQNSQRKAISIIIVFLTASELFYCFQKFNPFVPQELVFPQTSVETWLSAKDNQGRTWGFGPATLEPNVQTQLRIFSPEGYDPLYPRWYGSFVHSAETGKLPTIFTDQTRSNAQISQNGSINEIMQNPYRKRVLETVGMQYLLARAENNSSEETFSTDEFTLVYDQAGWRIYKSVNWNRAFITNDVKVYTSKEDFEKQFFSKSFDPLKAVLLERQVLPRNKEKLEGNVQYLSYSPNNFRYKVKTNMDALFFISDTYYPGWRAFVDGKETKIYRANYAFRAIKVPKGTHEVLMYYLPNSFVFGIYLSIMGLGTLLVFSYYAKHK